MKYTVEKSRSITSDLETIKELTFDLKHWQKWSPWMYMESEAANQTEGEVGVGQSMSWDGKIIGSGSVITKCINGSRIEFDLIFLKPFKSKATTYIELETEGDQVKVTWKMEGNVPFFLFFLKNLFKTLIGKDYTRGLKRLDFIANQGKVPAVISVDENTQPMEGFDVFEIRNTCHESELPTKMGATFQQLHQAVSSGIEQSEFLSLVYKVKLTKGLFYFGAAVKKNEQLQLNTELKSNSFKAHKVLKTTLKGDYQFLEDTWACGMMHVRNRKMKVNTSIPCYERYLKGPHNEENPENYITEVYIPVK